MAFLTLSGISSSPSRKNALCASRTAAALWASSSASSSASPHVQSLHARRRLTGLPDGSGRMHSGRCLSSGVRSDRPPSGKRGESKAQRADFLARSYVFRLRVRRGIADDVGGGTDPADDEVVLYDRMESEVEGRGIQTERIFCRVVRSTGGVFGVTWTWIVVDGGMDARSLSGRGTGTTRWRVRGPEGNVVAEKVV